MPQISIYLDKKLYLRLLEAGGNTSKVMQQALKKYLKEKG